MIALHIKGALKFFRVGESGWINKNKIIGFMTFFEPFKHIRIKELMLLISVYLPEPDRPVKNTVKPCWRRGG